MKTGKIKLNNCKIYSLLGMVALFGTIFMACDKDKNNLNGSANVMAVHAATDAKSANFFLDNTKMTNNPISYGENTAYVSVASGKRKASFKGGENNDVLVSNSVTLENKKNYTVFFAGTVAAPEVFNLEDDLKAPSAGKARVRFVNLSPDEIKLDIKLKAGEKLATARGYKSASNFMEVDPGNLTYEVLNNTDNSVVFTTPEFNIQQGKSYTIWIKGSKNGVEHAALGANLISHNK